VGCLDPLVFKKLVKVGYQKLSCFLESDKNWHKKLAKTSMFGVYPVSKRQILNNWRDPKQVLSPFVVVLYSSEP
jgi:hypothetical protein